MSDSLQRKPKRKKHKLLPIYHTFSWLEKKMNQNKNNINETSIDYVYLPKKKSIDHVFVRHIELKSLPQT